MQIVLTPIGSPKGGEQTINHDLNFQQEQYESTHTVVRLVVLDSKDDCQTDHPFQTFRNPKGELLERLKESAPAGESTNGAAAAAPKSDKKRPKANRNVDMEKLAEALPQLQEDDLLQVVQMVHDNKSEETYTKNDVESESFPRTEPLD
jgi:transcription initiation factor IIF auxiliary subunit